MIVFNQPALFSADATGNRTESLDLKAALLAEARACGPDGSRMRSPQLARCSRDQLRRRMGQHGAAFGRGRGGKSSRIYRVLLIYPRGAPRLNVALARLVELKAALLAEARARGLTGRACECRNWHSLTRSPSPPSPPPPVPPSPPVGGVLGRVTLGIIHGHGAGSLPDPDPDLDPSPYPDLTLTLTLT